MVAQIHFPHRILIFSNSRPPLPPLTAAMLCKHLHACISHTNTLLVYKHPSNVHTPSRSRSSQGEVRPALVGLSWLHGLSWLNMLQHFHTCCGGLHVHHHAIMHAFIHACLQLIAPHNKPTASYTAESLYSHIIDHHLPRQLRMDLETPRYQLHLTKTW
jgi:hypothetical protein